MQELERDNFFVRCHGPFEKGFVHRGHRHWIDHYTFVHDGTKISIKYRSEKDGVIRKQSVVEGPARTFIAAGIFHEIEVLSDVGYWDCEFTIPDGFKDLTDFFVNENR